MNSDIFLVSNKYGWFLVTMDETTKNVDVTHHNYAQQAARKQNNNTQFFFGIGELCSTKRSGGTFYIYSNFLSAAPKQEDDPRKTKKMRTNQICICRNGLM